MLKTKYVFNQDKLMYERIPFLVYYKTNLIIFAVFMIICASLYASLKQSEVDCTEELNTEVLNTVMPTKHDMILGSTEWRDSVFLDYEMRADLYLSRPEFKGSPITGAILSLAAHNAFDSTGILLPVELALAQGQWESGLGLKGRSPINNPYNVGEYDNGTVLWFNNTFEGVQAYYYLMTRNYLKCKPLKLLFKTFTNCSGHRYASADYETHVPKQYYYIKRWLKKELNKQSKNK